MDCTAGEPHLIIVILSYIVLQLKIELKDPKNTEDMTSVSSDEATSLHKNTERKAFVAHLDKDFYIWHVQREF